MKSSPRLAGDGAIAKVVLVKRNWLVLVVMALALVALTLRRPAGSVETKLDGVAPDWEMYDLQGVAIHGRDFAGRIVVLNFWATWCPPCRQEIPDFIEFARHHDTNRVLIVGASIDENTSLVRDFVHSHAIPYPVLLADGAAQAAFGPIEGVPTTFIIDAQGRFRSRHLGAMAARQLEAAVTAASGSAAPTELPR